MSEPESSVPAWLRKAEHDLLAIRSVLGCRQVPWDVICFHAQQAGEKHLKAFLVAHDQPVEWTHDLVRLLAACAALDPGLADL